MKTILIAVLFFISFKCQCQNSADPENRLCLKFSPLSLYTLYVGPSVRMSAEYKVKNNIALENEMGFFFYNTTGYLTRFEWKYYTDFDYKTVGNYFSAELFYKNQSYTTSDSFGLALKNYRVTKNVECFTIKFGRLSIYKYGFAIDGYLGLGIRFQQNKNTLSFIDNSGMESTHDYETNLILNQARNRIYPNIVAGVKIGFSILK